MSGVATLGMDRKRLFDEHGRLATKLVVGGLSDEETRQLAEVRHEIDLIEMDEIAQGSGLLGEELRKDLRPKL